MNLNIAGLRTHGAIQACSVRLSSPLGNDGCIPHFVIGDLACNKSGLILGETAEKDCATEINEVTEEVMEKKGIWGTGEINLLTFSPSHLLTFSPSHLLTFSPSHLLTFSPFHLFTFSPFHLFTFSPFHLFTFSVTSETSVAIRSNSYQTGECTRQWPVKASVGTDSVAGQIRWRGSIALWVEGCPVKANTTNSPERRQHKGEAYHPDLTAAGPLMAACS